MVKIKENKDHQDSLEIFAYKDILCKTKKQHTSDKLIIRTYEVVHIHRYQKNINKE